MVSLWHCRKCLKNFRIQKWYFYDNAENVVILVTAGCWKHCQNQTSSPCFHVTAKLLILALLQILQTELSTKTQIFYNPDICKNNLTQEKIFCAANRELQLLRARISCFTILFLWQIFSNCDEQSLFNKPKCFQFSLLKEKIKQIFKHCRKSEILMKLLQNI